MSVLNFLLQIVRSTYQSAVANGWWPPKDKVQWVSSIFVAAAATYFAYLTYRLNRARGTPILVLEHEGKDSTFIKNIGQGPAVNTFFTDADGEVLAFVGAIAASGRVAVPPHLTRDHERFRLYYHDVQRGILGRRLWTRTTLHSKSFDLGGHRTEPLIVDHARRIWLPPWTVLRQVKSSTPWESVLRATRWYDPLNWPRMLSGWWLPRYRNLKRWLDGRRQSPLHARFADELRDFPRDKPAIEARVHWDIFLDKLWGECGKRGGPFQLEQMGCGRLDDGGVICPVKLIVAVEEVWMKGLVYVPASVIAESAGTKEELSGRVFEAFRKYYCRWRPRTTFVHEIQI